MITFNNTTDLLTKGRFHAILSAPPAEIWWLKDKIMVTNMKLASERPGKAPVLIFASCGILDNVQMALDLQWFDLGFFDFTVVGKQYTFHRTCH